MPLLTDEEYTRFMRYVDVGECWLWTGGLVRGSEYGRFSLGYMTYLTHRLMLARKLGRELGDGMLALHSCRNRRCCNPDHLREGTPAENQADRKRDGTAYGIKTPSKLTDDQVRAIRADPRSQGVIAAEYGVNQSTISYIKSTKRRKLVLADQ